MDDCGVTLARVQLAQVVEAAKRFHGHHIGVGAAQLLGEFHGRGVVLASLGTGTDGEVGGMSAEGTHGDERQSSGCCEDQKFDFHFWFFQGLGG